VLGDPVKLGDFEECQQYQSTIVQNMSAQTKTERHISSVGTDGGNRGSSLVDKIKGGAYSDEQFRSLSPDDKQRVQKFRDEAKKKKNGKAKHRKEKRKLAKLKSDKEAGSGDEETESTSGKPAGSNAGAQFGANGNKAKKSKSST
jgi:hypothetical protein